MARVPDMPAQVPDMLARVLAPASDNWAVARATSGAFGLRRRPAQQEVRARSEERSDEFAFVGLLEARRGYARRASRPKQ